MMRYFTCLLFVVVLGGYGTWSGSGYVVRQAASLPDRGGQTNWRTAEASTSWQLVEHTGDRLLNPASTNFAVTVKGRIELVNSKLKARGGKIDASGVVVWLTAVDGATPRPASRQRSVITQRNKRFLPHIVALEAGSEVSFPNEDPFFHNVFSIFNGKRFDLGLYASGETRPVNFNRPGISYIFCNIHPHMSAVVVTLDTPHYAVSDPGGNLVFTDIPAGNYRLSVWHERAKPETLAALTRTVQVSAGGLDLGVIRISEEGYVPRPHPNKYGQEYDSQHQRPGYRKP